PFAIGGPRWIDFVNARMVSREIARVAVLDRNGEDVAAGFDNSASACGRDGGAADAGADGFELGACFNVFCMNDNGQVARFDASEIEFVEETPVFIDDRVGAEAGPLDVEFLVVGELFGLLGGEV